jgi:hypothetical protein
MKLSKRTLVQTLKERMMKTLRLCTPIHPLRHVSTALTLMALLSVSHPTLAQETNRKVYPGTFCQLESQAVGLTVFYDERGAILNDDSTSPVTVICPVVRDETEGTGGIRRAFVRYVKGAGGGGDRALSCTLHSRNHVGVAVVNPVERTDTRGPGTKIFSFGPVRNSDQGFPGYYLFVCVIPRPIELPDGSFTPQSGIISYRVDEIRTSGAQTEELFLDEDEEGVSSPE